MNCALSASAPLAIAGTEVLESIVRGGLAAPNDVYLNRNRANNSGFPCLWPSRQVLSQGCVKLLHEAELGRLFATSILSKEPTHMLCRRCLTIERLSSNLPRVRFLGSLLLTIRISS
jgi:hypothetical protein